MSIDVVGKIVRVTIASIMPDTQVQENNINYICTVSGGTDTRAALGNAVQTLFNTNWLPLMSNVSSIYGNRVGTIFPRPPEIAIETVNQVNGAVGGVTMPTQSRAVLGFVTALAGPRYRGRLYLPTVDSGKMTTTSYPAAAVITASGVLGTALIAPIVSGGSTWQPVILHKTLPPTVVYTTTPITGRVSVRFYGTQRRSGNYGRTNPLPW
jgi:hypothetical protein